MSLVNNRTFNNHKLLWDGPTNRPSFGPYGGNGLIGANLWNTDNTWNIGIDHAKVWDLRMDGRPWDDVSFQEISDAVKQNDWKKLESLTEKFHGSDKLNPFNLNLAKLSLEFQDDISLFSCIEHIDFKNGNFGTTLQKENIQLNINGWVARGQPRVWLNLCSNYKTSILIKLKRTPFKPHIEEPLKYDDPTPLTHIGFTQKLHDEMYYGISLLDETGMPISNTQMIIEPDTPKQICLTIAQGCTSDFVLEQLLDRNINILDDKAYQRQWWSKFWSKSMVDTGNSSLNAVWHTGIYALACCSHEKGLPITLQGLWTEDGAPGTWGGYIFSNLNTQISYWACCGANHPELLKPLLDFMLSEEVMNTMERETQDFYGLPGIALPVATDCQGRRVYSWLPIQIWSTAGAWLCQSIWSYIKCQRETGYLERAYELFRKTETFLTAYVHRQSDKCIDFTPTHSPEVFDLTPKDMWLNNPTIDLWIYKTLLKMCIEASEYLNVNPEDRKCWQKRIVDLPDYPIREVELWSDGSDRFESETTARYLIEGEDVKTELSHRHLSHCAPIYPGSDINIESNDKSLALHSIRQNIRRGTGLWIGYSFVWQSCLAARCRLGPMAQHHLLNHWDHFTAPNGFHANGETSGVGISDFDREYYDHLPMSVEATLAAPAAVQEMLLQTWGGLIRVFPALPISGAASFKNLRSENGFLVSAQVDQQGFVFLELLSPESESCAEIEIQGSWELLIGKLISITNDHLKVRAIQNRIVLQFQKTKIK